MESKSLIIITTKSGTEKRVNVPDTPDDVIALLVNRNNSSDTWAVRDVDGSWLIINKNDFSTIEIIPQE